MKLKVNFILTIIIVILGLILLVQATNLDQTVSHWFDRAPKLEVNSPLSSDLPDNLTFQEYLERGDELLASGILEFAIAHFAKAQSLEPDSAIPLLKIANAYFDHDQFNQAVQNAQKALEKQPENSSAQVILLKSFLAASNLSEAERVSIALENPDIEGSYYKGLLAAISGDRDTAGSFLHRTVQLASQNPSPQNITWQEKAQRLIDTYHHYDEFRESPNPHFRALLAEALAANNEPALALQVAESLTTDFPEYRDAWIILGHSELALDKPNDAIKAFAKAITLDPTNPAPRYYLALTYLQLHDPDAALTNLQIAADLGWSDTLALTEKKALAHIQNEDWDKAAAAFETILAETDNLTPSFLIQPLFLFFDKLNQPDKALEPTANAITNFPKSALAHALRGRALFETGDFDGAKTELDLALELDSTLPEAHLFLGDWFQTHRQNTEALDHFRQAFELDPDSEIGQLAASRFNSLR